MESVYALTSDPSFYWRVRGAGGLLAEESQRLLNVFFAARRQEAQTDEKENPPCR
jgi:hypothetical protein